jgi:hypothetical protein
MRIAYRPRPLFQDVRSYRAILHGMVPHPLDGANAWRTASHESHRVDDSIAKLHVVQIVAECVHLDQLQRVLVTAVRVMGLLVAACVVVLAFVFGIPECNLLGVQPVNVALEGFGLVI